MPVRRKMNRIMLTLCLLTALATPLWGAPHGAAAQTPEPPPGSTVVVNGSFEEPALSGKGVSFAASIPGWRVTSGASIELHNQFLGPAFGAQQYVKLSGNATQAIAQDVPTIPGTMYVFDLAFSPRPGAVREENALRVLWNNQPIDELRADGSGLTTTAWNVRTYFVVATGSVTPLRFEYVGRPGEGSGVLLDAIRIGARTCVTLRAGDWHDPNTWQCGIVPGAGNAVVVNHPVTNNGAANARDLTVRNALQMSSAAYVQLIGNLLNEGSIKSGRVVMDMTPTNAAQPEDRQLILARREAILEASLVALAQGTNTAALHIISGSPAAIGDLVVQTTGSPRAATGGPVLQLFASGISFKNVAVEPGITLKLAADSLDIKGDWTNNGAFEPGQGAIRFSGATPQVISGISPTTFYDLLIDNQAGVRVDAAVTVEHTLNLATDVTLGTGSLTPAPGATVEGPGNIRGRYSFSGFFAPVNSPPAINRIKAGRAIPLKFSLGGDHGLDIFASGYPVSQRVTCDTAAPVGALEQAVPTRKRGFSYNPASHTYTYVWKTAKGWAGTCRRVIIRLDDGSEHSALFKFK